MSQGAICTKNLGCKYYEKHSGPCVIPPAPSAVPCPACDARDMVPIEALALGVTLGAAFGEQHAVTEKMCDLHRPLFVVAMMRAAVLSNEVQS